MKHLKYRTPDVPEHNVRDLALPEDRDPFQDERDAISSSMCALDTDYLYDVSPIGLLEALGPERCANDPLAIDEDALYSEEGSEGEGDGDADMEDADQG